MKKGLPKFLLLTDPYNSIEDRVLIFKTEFPRYILELNRSDDPESYTVNLHGKDYSVVVRRNLDRSDEMNINLSKEAVRWYHYALNIKNEPKKDI